MPVVYDIEILPNVFTLSTVGCDTDDRAAFEFSERRNDMPAMIAWLWYLAQNRVEMVGFNSLGFDYVLLHLILNNPGVTIDLIYQKAQAIINSGDRFAHTIWPSDVIIPQIDLFKIHHFDNIARATSLKSLQFNMRSPSVEDLPFPFDQPLTPEQIPVLLDYNMHDCEETKKFWHESKDQIAFRREVTARYSRDFMNHNDTKIGKDYFVMRLEDVSPGSCYTRSPKRPVQTIRHHIDLVDVILPYIQFQTPEFQRMADWFKTQTIYETKGVFTNLSCTVDGFEFHFGSGGIHGSVHRQYVREDDTHVIIDLDVTSYYPALAIANQLYPEHLGELFYHIYAELMAERQTYAKGTTENAMLKLALNGVYGDSNNPYSPFFDSQYTMAITINGQLLLCLLYEILRDTLPFEMIQINTDGLTIRVPRDDEYRVESAKNRWEQYTGLMLEENRYTHMYVRDCNNYIALDTDGEIKRKGAYESAPPGERTPLGWHQDCSALIVPKAAEAHLLRGEDIEDFINRADDPFDFMCRAKVPRNSMLMHGDTQVQNTTRYYVALHGVPLTKESPPVAGAIEGNFKRASGIGKREYDEWHAAWGNTWSPDIHTKNRSRYETRRIGICKGWDTAICNRAAAFDWENLNYDWYISETEKLV